MQSDQELYFTGLPLVVIGFYEESARVKFIPIKWRSTKYLFGKDAYIDDDHKVDSEEDVY